MFFSIQSADHPSLARPHWFNALGGAVNRFAGGSTELAGGPAARQSRIPSTSRCPAGADRLHRAIRVAPVCPLIPARNHGTTEPVQLPATSAGAATHEDSRAMAVRGSTRHEG